MIFKLAWRSIWRNKRRTIITAASIGLGLGVAILFIAFAEGVYVQIINDSVRMQAGHLTLEHPEYRDAPAVNLFLADSADMRRTIDQMDEVEITKLMILGQGVAKTGLATTGVGLVGVEPGRELITSPLVSRIIKGRYLNDSDGSKVVVGEALAKRLHLKVGKKMVITTNDVEGSLTEELCRVVGIFRTGVEEVDGYMVQASIGFLRKLYGLPEGAATQLGVVLKNANTQKKVSKKLTALFGNEDTAVRSWREIMPGLASYIKMDKGSNIILQAILIFLVLFTIFNTISMSIMERQKEFAVLKAIGTGPWFLRFQLLMESALIGLIGCILGIVIGGAVSFYLQVQGLDISFMLEEGLSISGFAVSPRIHADVTLGLLLGMGGLVMIATLLLSLIPMGQATRIKIADTLRSS